ncbi:MAG: DUF3581 family protein [Cellvibrionales bacterium]|nr:DUF3581 family protein [Cellvibrionales bacterium]
MFLFPFFQQENDLLTITPEQGSRFAKEIANDFNPIHDPEAKRYCVPGDLLFSLALMKYGLYQNMHFHFQGMVGKSTPVKFLKPEEKSIHILDDKEKTILQAHCDGQKIADTEQQAALESFIRGYVSFSGHNFIQILEPLMQKHSVMINPQRPLIIYESMSFSLEVEQFKEAVPKLTHSELHIDGKRGDAHLYFDIFDGETVIGSGKKTLILSSLRPYDAPAMQEVKDVYIANKKRYELSAS